MKKALKKISATTCYHFVDGKKFDGAPSYLSGDVTGLYGDVSGDLSGNVTGLYGDVSGDLSGNVSGLYGNVSGGLRGNVSGLRGNVDDCGITDDERKSGVSVSNLIGE
jgi:hypothetical protein